MWIIRIKVTMIISELQQKTSICAPRKMKNLPSIVQAWVRGATDSIEVSRAEAVAVWYGRNEATLTLLISTGDLAQPNRRNWNHISGKSNSTDVNYLKMRGFWDGRRNGDGEGLGLTPADILAAGHRAERKIDLAAKEAISAQVPNTQYRDRVYWGFGVLALPQILLRDPPFSSTYVLAQIKILLGQLFQPNLRKSLDIKPLSSCCYKTIYFGPNNRSNTIS